LAAKEFIDHAEAKRWRRAAAVSILSGIGVIGGITASWAVSGRSDFSPWEAFALLTGGMMVGSGFSAGLTARYWRLLADLRADMASPSAEASH
jgi:hypothetical protein